MKSMQNKFEGTTPRRIIIKVLKVKDEERILTTARRVALNKHESSMESSADLSSETLEPEAVG